ncbi:MAG: glycosyltransferase family 4 protein [Anaerolineae bacterium]|nr:glycosyltransferase family 4 protein [Anaerolineae bacterium]
MDFAQARVFIQRAWMLAEFSERVLPLYVNIHLALGDLEAVRDAYKRLGMKKADQNDIPTALKYFQSSMYTYSRYQRGDKYQYDYDILTRIAQLARLYRFPPRRQPTFSPQRKIKVAYLTYLMWCTTSVFQRINLLLAQFHEKSRFEVAFFSLDPESTFEDKHLPRFVRDHQCKLIAVPDSNLLTGEVEKIVWLATQIYNFKPDLLVTNAGLADLRHYFLVSLHPAPLKVAAVYGPPPQFVAPDFDWSIPSARHPFIDSPCPCSFVELEPGLPERAQLEFCHRLHFSIPQDAIILVSAGRVPKFQSVEFWRAILAVLGQHPTCYYLVIGVQKEELPFLTELLTPEIESRLRFLGWIQDYIKVLGMADIVIDTFPSGGGFTLMDAMALGIPVVSFTNNYSNEFNQTDWSVAEEFVLIPDLLVERGNFAQFQSVLAQLIQNQAYRLCLGEHCKTEIYQLRGNPERMVRNYEAIYCTILKDNDLKRKVAQKYTWKNLYRLDNVKNRIKLWLLKTLPTRYYQVLGFGYRLAMRIKRKLFRTPKSLCVK